MPYAFPLLLTLWIAGAVGLSRMFGLAAARLAGDRAREAKLPYFSIGLLPATLLFGLHLRHGIDREAALHYYSWTIFATAAFGAAWLATPGARRWLAGAVRSNAAAAVVLLLAFASLLWNGAFLEFPTDPTHHLAELYLASSDYRTHTVNNFVMPILTYKKILYFHYYSLLSLDGVLHWDYPKVSALAAANALILMAAVYRLILFILPKPGLATIAMVFAVLSSGSSIFNFYRYYALAPTILTFVVYMELALLTLSALKSRKPILILFYAPLLPLMAMDHPQELLLLLLLWCSLVAYHLLSRLARLEARRRRFAIGGLVALVAALSLGAGYYESTLETRATFPNYFHIFRDGNKSWFVHNVVRTVETLGVFGLACLAFSAAVLLGGRATRDQRFIAFIFLFILVGILYNPIALKAFGVVMHDGGTYFRVLYGTFYSLAPFLYIAQLPERVKIGWGPRSFMAPSAAYAGALILLLACSLAPAKYPFHGRAQHFFRQHDPELGLERHRELRIKLGDYARDCLPAPAFMIADGYLTKWARSTGGIQGLMDRFYKYPIDEGLHQLSLDNLLNPAGGPWLKEPMREEEFHRHVDTLGFSLFAHRAPAPPRGTWAQDASWHWVPGEAFTEGQYPEAYLGWLEGSPDRYRLIFDEDGVKIFSRTALDRCPVRPN